MPWAPDYVSADDVAEFVRVDDDVDDVDYARVATTASRAVDNATHRQFGRTSSEQRFYTPRWSYTKGGWVITTDDYVVLTEVAVDVRGNGSEMSVIPTNKIIKLDRDAPAKSRPWTSFLVRSEDFPSVAYANDCVRGTGEWGWASVPVAIEEATLLQASRLTARRDSPMGVAGSPESGSELRLLAKLDPDVLTSIKDYVRRALP